MDGIIPVSINTPLYLGQREKERQKKRERRQPRQKPQSFYNLTSEVIFYCFCRILSNNSKSSVSKTDLL